MQIPPYTLYGLVGCPHCEAAEQFLRVRNLPVGLVIANEDPIADAGVKELTGGEDYPVLVNKITKSILKGFDEGKYRELAEDFYARSGAGAPNVFGGGVAGQPAHPAPAPVVVDQGAA